MSLIIYKLFPTFAQYLIYISLNLTVPCYGVYEYIVTMACYAWNQLAHNVDLVKSIMYRDWINTPC
ncbi:hypothetical protein [Candidatus Tisiphia endosymbiont of Neophilaenus lineatus]|uniref:hypothetical protein n=1 Tax=Candidatus Tisiphia endosymbiont of Neophilaenus lineatus TaxID=3139336 RepID=UPI0035CA72FA